jgi:cyclic pyranopterin phosphate synthase
MTLSHLDESGRAHMVDVGAKGDTRRRAVARGRVMMLPSTLDLIKGRGVAKGDVLVVAQIAGIQAAKRTHELIPLCHPLLLTHLGVELTPMEAEGQAWIEIEATAQSTGPTGVEMEALTAVSVAALTVYDMCKAADRGMRLSDLRLVHKSGGKSGEWNREEA